MVIQFKLNALTATQLRGRGGVSVGTRIGITCDLDRASSSNAPLLHHRLILKIQVYKHEATKSIKHTYKAFGSPEKCDAGFFS